MSGLSEEQPALDYDTKVTRKRLHNCKPCVNVTVNTKTNCQRQQRDT